MYTETMLSSTPDGEPTDHKIDYTETLLECSVICWGTANYYLKDHFRYPGLDGAWAMLHGRPPAGAWAMLQALADPHS